MRACILLTCLLCCCQSAMLSRFSWSYDDMVTNCKPWVSVQVTTEDSSGPRAHNISLRLSTSSIINERVVVQTSRNNFTARGRAPCLYRGKDINTGESVFASEMRGLLNMTFKYKDNWYRSSKPMNSSTPAVAQEFKMNNGGIHRCHYKVPPNSPGILRQNDSNHVMVSSDPGAARGLSPTLTSFDGSVPKKMLELVLVLDRSFVNRAGGESKAVAGALEITNYVNLIYQALRLRVVLTNVIVVSTDVMPVSIDAEATLVKFTEYQANQLNMRHDTAMLLSSMPWDSSILGVAWFTGLCNRIYSSGIVTDAYTDPVTTAFTVAHEMGHNLGLLHAQDVAGCICSDNQCVMSTYAPESNSLNNITWSTCSVDDWKSQANAPWRSCLADAPDTSFYSSRSPMCGNGILEDGEQCDCGLSETCSSKCCNATICRFKWDAVCASGPCCDWNSCTLRPTGAECRSAVGVCDVPETCSGSSEWCPSDDKVADGVECARGKAYCYHGQCKPADAQCRILFSSDARAADDKCFSVLNTRNETSGHCDLRLEKVSVFVFGTESFLYANFSHSQCKAADVKCGLLHCSTDHRPTDATTSVVNSTHGSHNCTSWPNWDTSSSGVRSPSLVPDGAKCGHRSMCINSTCTPLSSVTDCLDCPDCSGNGVLTKSNLCFCKPSFAPPDCLAEGCGGSVTSPLACVVAGTSGTTTKGMTTGPAVTAGTAAPLTTKTAMTTMTTTEQTMTTRKSMTVVTAEPTVTAHTTGTPIELPKEASHGVSQSIWLLVLVSSWAIRLVFDL